MTRHLAVLVVGLALCQADGVFSSTLAVNPTIVSLGGRSATALLTLSNEGGDDVKVEATVVSWSQDEHGTMALSPTGDLVVFPLLFTIPAHGERRIRIGLTRREPAAVERSYRVIVEELPSSRAARPARTGGAIYVRSRFSVPVFVEPPKSSGTVVVETPTVGSGHLRFRLVNPGNAHVKLMGVTVSVEGADGTVVARHELAAWYLLAGGVRAYDLPLDQQECAAASSFLIEATWPGGSASNRLAAPPNGCR